MASAPAAGTDAAAGGPVFWAVIVACVAVLRRVGASYARIAAFVRHVKSVDASGRVAPLVAPLEAVPFGAYDGAYVGRLLRALDADGRAAYRSLYSSGDAFAAPIAYATLACAACRWRRVPVPALWLAAAVAADVAASLAHARLLDAFPAPPAAYTA